MHVPTQPLLSGWHSWHVQLQPGATNHCANAADLDSSSNWCCDVGNDHGLLPLVVECGASSHATTGSETVDTSVRHSIPKAIEELDRWQKT